MSLKPKVEASCRVSVEAAEQMLSHGGNAVDAAIAAAFAACAGEPVSGGFGGGGLLLYLCDGESEASVCDFLCNAPGLEAKREKGEEEFPAPDFEEVETAERQAIIGRATAAVPGTLLGLMESHERWGQLPLEQVLAPTVRMLAEGAALSPEQHSLAIGAEDFLRRCDVRKHTLFDSNQQLLAVGQPVKNPALSELLEKLGQDGPSYLYEIEYTVLIAQEFCEELGGWMTLEDVREYQPEFYGVSGAKDGDKTVFAANKSSNSPESQKLLADAWQVSTASVVDSEGNAANIALSQGIGSGFGVPGMGIAINNLLGSQMLLSEGQHGYLPGKRISSSLETKLFVPQTAKVAV